MQRQAGAKEVLKGQNINVPFQPVTLCEIGKQPSRSIEHASGRGSRAR
jgi:hypothetical protein